MSVPGAAVRGLAARVLRRVLEEGRSLKAAMADVLPGVADPRDRALLEAICFAALRHRRRYEFALRQWLPKPLPKRDSIVHMLLLAGLAQLDALGLPAHAAVAASVEAARSLERPRLAPLVNAVLRRACREPLPESDSPAVRHSHPDWLYARMREDWPADLDAIVAANNRQAPQWLRVPGAPADRSRYLARLRDEGVEAIAPEFPVQGLCLEAPLPTGRLPGWDDGATTVQDGAAQLAVAALRPRGDELMLDACAAPGGKCAQLAEILGDTGSLLALEVDAVRLQRVAAALARLGLESPRVELRAADVARPDLWWDGNAFDAILLDAPCSATGIIRRQPDIKWHRRAADIPVLVAQQARLLDQAWTTLAPGGRLLYCTCSVLKQENEGQVAAFLARTGDAEAMPLDARFGRLAGPGRQRLPGEDGMDGFYYALLRRRPAAGGQS